MKKILLGFVAMLLMTSGLLAQSFKLYHEGEEIANGEEFVANEVEYDMYIISRFDVKNVSSSSKDFLIRKREIAVVPGTTNTFCYSVACLPPNVFITPLATTLAAGATESSFKGDVSHNGIEGTNIIMYTFYDANNANDSVAVVVKYPWPLTNATDLDMDATASLSQPMPNPVLDRVQFNFNMNGVAHAQMIIRDITGKEVKRILINGGDEMMSADISSLDSGLYFCTLTADNRILATRKLIKK